MPEVRPARFMQYGQANSSALASPRMAPKPPAISIGRAVAAPSPIAMPRATHAASAVAVDVTRYANAITIVSANVPLARSSSGAGQTPAGAGGSASAPGQTPAQPANAAVPSMTGVSPNTSIRPMTAPPIAMLQQGSGVSGPVAQVGSGVVAAHGGSAPTVGAGTGGGFTANDTPMSGSGSYGPPRITGGWGSSMVSGSGSSYTINNSGYAPNGELPIGAVPIFNVSAPAGTSGQVATVTWFGGTTIGNYLSTGADQTPPSTQAAPTSPVPTNQVQYSFIVQAEAPGQSFNYTIKATVTYQGDLTNTPYTSTLTFKSDSPASASLALAQGIGYAQSYTDGTTGNTWIQLATNVPPVLNTDAGIRIQATTQAHDFQGTFMFLQIIDADNSKYVRNRNSQITYIQTNLPAGNPGPNLDSNGSRLAYGEEDGTFSWQVSLRSPPPPPIVQQAMHDSPGFAAPPGSSDRMSLGFPGGGTPNGFTTYLMFMPQDNPPLVGGGAVWVAISQVYWTFGQAVIVNLAGGTTFAISTDQPTSDPDHESSASGNAVGTWPTWTGVNPSTNSQFVQYNGPNPWPQ